MNLNTAASSLAIAPMAAVVGNSRTWRRIDAKEPIRADHSSGVPRSGISVRGSNLADLAA
ncbi:hypothetical protein [Mycobacteroides abscessus]|uniref:hypothetical protein n=1 Tax=Mycobacteroides abscessus TaxID=36809 RepID=UPI00103FE138|nr:hypothetical protein [Mycobacteroides abscessus]